MSWPIGVMAGTHVEVVGVEDDPDGGVRVFFGHRSDGRYVWITDEVSVCEVRETWAQTAQRVTMVAPLPEQVFQTH
jgi:hypothetical protein